MAFELPPLPNFNVQTPDFTQKALEGAQLRNMLSEMALRKALAPSQVQTAQAQAQQAQQTAEIQRIQLQDSQIMSDYLKNGEVAQTPSDFSVGDKITSFTGIPKDDPIMGFLSGLAKKGFSGPGLLATAQSMLQKRSEYNKGTEELQAIQKNDRLYWQDEMAKLHALPQDQRSVQLAADLPGLLENSKSDPRLQQFVQALNGHPEHIDEIYGTVIGENAALDLRKKAAEATEAEQKQQQGKIGPTGLSPEMLAEAQKEITVAKATQPLKIETAMAEAKAKQLLEGLTKPGYAFNPATGQTQLTDQTAYLQSGGRLQGFRGVTEKDVRDDTMLTNRLGDVHQKLAQYEQALQKPITDKEKGDIAGLLGGGMKVGISTTEIPMDRVNSALNAENLKGLSANARDQLVAYRNMREAMLGYKTVLSGSARGSDKTLELIEQTVPNPAVTDPDFSRRSIDSFRGNLRIVGQGLPQLPGVKSPAQVENEVRGVPSVGDIVDGYRFKGGDPSKRENWEKPK